MITSTVGPDGSADDEPWTATPVRVAGGVLRARRERGLTVLRGVRYATAARFAEPVPEEPWTGERDALADVGVPPQPASRPTSGLGVITVGPLTEDCLRLTVATPAADDRRRPVLVFLHGGGYRSGGVAWGRYDPRRLAREGDAVVVSVGSRIGALGWLRLPGLAPGNLGLLDQLTALRWIRDNAAALGGDPDRITLVGHSSGAHAVACLIGVPAARGLFHRAIAQSPPLGLGLGSPAASARAAAAFVRRLGTDPRDATVAEIVAAQERTERDLAVRTLGGLVPAFMPVAGAEPLPAPDEWRDTAREGAKDLQVVVGTAERELAYFFRDTPLATVPGLQQASTARVFTRPAQRFAELLASGGARVHTYRVGAPGPSLPLRGAHCGELPWLFGTEADWAGAPILNGRSWAEVTADGAPMRAAWLRFAATGDPGWPADPARPHRF
ncbi:carboxylesterase family protein [Catenuloplanes atrovinosus]|uniref:Para-nitrobenzyl esterase n=1 Tax=Catenuloplanes atrovinosus TaxID=137266 RepID=A0AAE3YPS8_9ACTN|nr:carboxylesterase family protein [Catenuloplanes atrovinosus]MDR7276422.1 para-nitrobenzyl esterase [Catenuloplanes atrovinosus]